MTYHLEARRHAWHTRGLRAALRALPALLLALFAAGAGVSCGESGTSGNGPSGIGLLPAAACINGPSVYDGSFDDAALQAVIALHPGCVRVNVRRDVWSSITDPTPRGRLQRGLLGTYDALVDAYLAAGIEVYMLVHSEAAGRAPENIRTPEGLDAYARAFTDVVSHFRDRVKVYEVFNEPNNWVRENTPALEPRDFARVLARVYRDVRVAHRDDPCWYVLLVSGAPLAFRQGDGTENTAADYLDETYREGIAHEGWEDIRRETGSYPLDGVGYHIYLPVEPSGETEMSVRHFLDAAWGVVARYEGADTSKRLYVSEFGWQAGETEDSERDQARELEAAYAALLADPRVAVAMWFTLQDFYVHDPSAPEGRRLERWGLYRSTGLGDGDARPSRASFREVARSHRPVAHAALAWVDAPRAMAPGARATVRLRATNMGSNAWTRDTSFRAGAGPGVPFTCVANGLRWGSFGAAGGYENGVNDARAFLPEGVTVRPGEAHEFAFEVTAPSEPGRVPLVARMVQEGISWFGRVAQRDVEVVDPARGSARRAAERPATYYRGWNDLPVASCGAGARLTQRDDVVTLPGGRAVLVTSWMTDARRAANPVRPLDLVRWADRSTCSLRPLETEPPCEGLFSRGQRSPAHPHFGDLVVVTERLLLWFDLTSHDPLDLPTQAGVNGGGGWLRGAWPLVVDGSGNLNFANVRNAYNFAPNRLLPGARGQQPQEGSGMSAFITDRAADDGVTWNLENDAHAVLAIHTPVALVESGEGTLHAEGFMVQSLGHFTNVRPAADRYVVGTGPNTGRVRAWTTHRFAACDNKVYLETIWRSESDGRIGPVVNILIASNSWGREVERERPGHLLDLLDTSNETCVVRQRSVTDNGCHAGQVDYNDYLGRELSYRSRASLTRAPPTFILRGRGADGGATGWAIGMRPLSGIYTAGVIYDVHSACPADGCIPIPALDLTLFNTEFWGAGAPNVQVPAGTPPPPGIERVGAEYFIAPRGELIARVALGFE